MATGNKTQDNRGGAREGAGRKALLDLTADIRLGLTEGFLEVFDRDPDKAIKKVGQAIGRLARAKDKRTSSDGMKIFLDKVLPKTTDGEVVHNHFQNGQDGLPPMKPDPALTLVPKKA